MFHQAAKDVITQIMNINSGAVFADLPIELLPLLLSSALSNCTNSTELQSTLFSLQSVSRTWRSEALRFNKLVIISLRQLSHLVQLITSHHTPLSLRLTTSLILDVVITDWSSIATSMIEVNSRKLGLYLKKLEKLELHGSLGGWSLAEFVAADGFVGINHLVVGPSSASVVRSENNMYFFTPPLSSQVFFFTEASSDRYPFLWRCPNLITIEILSKVPAVLTNGLGDLSPPSLTTLKIGSLEQSSVFGLRNLSEGLSTSSASLQIFHLTSYSCRTPESLGGILANLKNLRELSLGPCGTEQTDDSILWSSISLLPSLQIISASPRRPIALLYSLATLKNLSSLSLKGSLSINDLGTMPSTATEDLGIVIRRICWLKKAGGFAGLKRLILEKRIGMPKSRMVELEIEMLEKEGVVVGIGVEF